MTRQELAACAAQVAWRDRPLQTLKPSFRRLARLVTGSHAQVPADTLPGIHPQRAHTADNSLQPLPQRSATWDGERSCIVAVAYLARDAERSCTVAVGCLARQAATRLLVARIALAFCHRHGVERATERSCPDAGARAVRPVRAAAGAPAA
jgi:hypothetical protein